MTGVNTLIQSMGPSETADSSDYDESEDVDTSKSNIKNNDHNRLDETSLIQCRASGSLVDGLENEDRYCENDLVMDECGNAQSDNTTGTTGTKTSQHNDELHEINGNGKIDHAINSANENSMRSHNEILSSGLATEPLSNYLLSRRLSVSTIPFLQQQQQPLTSKDIPKSWDHLLRSGTRLKTLVSDALGEVKNTITTIQNNAHRKRERDDSHNLDDEILHDHESPPSNQQSRVVAVADFTVELAREKTAQVMQLQRQLKDAQAQSAAVQAANASLREETSSGQSRLDRTVESLRIASTNAAKARADADAAEATATTLAQTLQNLQTVLTETKNASQILHQEQQEINETVAIVESKLIKKEAELLHAKKDISTLRNSNEAFVTAQSKFAQERDNFEQQVKNYEKELDELKHEKSELAMMEKARKQRSEKVEQEWRKAQTLLIEATSGQAAALQTQAALEKTIASLTKANEDVHASLREHQRIARDDKHRLTETLGKVEKEAQRLRIHAEATEEEMARLKAVKASAEKQIQQLKSRLSTVERSLKEATTMIVTTPTSMNVSPDAVTTPIIPNQLSFRLPPLATTGKKSTSLLSTTTTSIPTITEKENIAVQNGELCSICYKPCIGIMKVCQCGSVDCHKKAHTNCIKFMINPSGPSVSHPGTPAPKLPVVLCDHHGPRMMSTTKLRPIHNHDKSI